MSKYDEVYQYTASKLEYLWSITGTGKGRGMMANLRRGVGRQPGELPELWGMIFDRMPDELLGKNQTSYAEWAVYTALTLYAMHQQSSDRNMNQKDISVGQASAKLVKNEDDTERILKRLNLVVTAVSPEDLAYHLRGMIQLFRQEEIALDYAKLAKELYLFQYEENVSVIGLNWGRDFWSECNKKIPEKEKKEND